MRSTRTQVRVGCEVPRALPSTKPSAQMVSHRMTLIPIEIVFDRRNAPLLVPNSLDRPASNVSNAAVELPLHHLDQNRPIASILK